jgi:mannose-6-phosphate isomerase-like protein (cupin superfamily)
MVEQTRRLHAVFDVAAVAATLPETAETMIVDHRMTDEPEASARVFRVYRPTPAHYHEISDEYLYVLSGRAMFFMGDEPIREVRPGQLLFFKKQMIHGMPTILEHPMVFMSIDTPRRPPGDIVFVDAGQYTADEFVRTQGGGAVAEGY